MTEKGSIFGLSPKKAGSPKKPRPTKEETQPQEPRPEEAARAAEDAGTQRSQDETTPAPEKKKRPSRRRRPRSKAKPKTEEQPQAVEQAAETDAPTPDTPEAPAVAEATGQQPAADEPTAEAPEMEFTFEEEPTADAQSAEADAAPEAAEAPAPEATFEPVQDAPQEAGQAEPDTAPAEEAQDEAAREAAERRKSQTEQYASTRPDGVVEPDDALPEMTFEALPEVLREACIRAGWDQLMPVQALSMPYLMARRDLMIQSRTGSGKTGSFLLPIMERMDPAKAECQALVLVPTRELAQQVAREAETLFKGTGLRVVSVYGGTGYGPQLDAMREGAHLVVGTPGRVLDHLLRRSLTLDGIQILVFDEADRMLSIGFYPDMKQVQRYLPGRKVNMFMTSATYPPHVMRLAGDFMDNPQILSLSHSNVHIAETPHSYYEVKPMEKDRALVRIIEMENPASAFIFCNTKQNVHYITAVLQRFGYEADELSGDLTQNKREQVLGRIRKGQLRFLVATDVAARGIDIPDLSHVFLYEPPEDHEVYIHRAGRTGRAGASGEVISMVDVMEKFALERIGKMYKINFEKRELPTDEDVQGVIGMRMTALLEARLRGLDNVQRERLNRTVGLAKSLGETEEGLELIAMLLDDIYQGTLSSSPTTPPSKDGDKPKGGGRGGSKGSGGGPKKDGDRDRDRSAGRSRSRRRPNKSQAQDKSRDQRPATQGGGGGGGSDKDSSGKDKGPSGQDGDKPKPKRRRRRRPRRRNKPSEGGGGGEPNGNVIPAIKDVNGNK